MFLSKYSMQQQALAAISCVNFVRMGKTSNASRNITKPSTVLGLQAKFKKLLRFAKWAAGRTQTGRITVFTKGARKKKVRPAFLNYSLRDSGVSVIGGINHITTSNKVTMLVFSASGLVSYAPFKASHSLFMAFKLRSILEGSVKANQRSFRALPSFREIYPAAYLLVQHKKSLPVSSLELVPLSGVKYTRSMGTKSFIKKLDTRTGLSLVVLSSGLHKVFSIYSLATSGPAMLPVLAKAQRNSKFGFYSGLGKKPKVRGVAKNPVDHPHGGKKKSIKYPRTPWGKTTKFK